MRKNALLAPLLDITSRRARFGKYLVHQANQAAAQPALGECLGIPGEKRHRPDRSQVQQAAFHAPVHGGGGVFDVSRLFQFFNNPLFRAGISPKGERSSLL